MFVEEKLKKPGKLVRFRGRRCVVQPSPEEGVILLKPLGAGEDEMMAVYEPVMRPHDRITDDHFEEPGLSDLGNFLHARLLYDAARLSFRQVSGPFRCMGKLSFRPRAYQLVPLITALKMQVTRLLIADDVGIGKTVEALLILRELMERGVIDRFAVLCPPHLCEQWQKELADKLDIEAEIIRPSTMAALERKIIGDDMDNPFNYYPYQVISIDYVKSGSKLPYFLKEAAPFIIVDEVHTCARPANLRDNQQLRFHLLRNLANDPERHMVFLTATPHSGKDEEFNSLLSLLKPEFDKLDLATMEPSKKKEIARYFIQRKRKSILKWEQEFTPFPDRISHELPYKLSPEYADFYLKMLRFARGISAEGLARQQARMKYWAALALLRGVMSSPAAGAEMLTNRRNKKLEEDTGEELENPNLEKDDENSDVEPGDLIDYAGLNAAEINDLQALSQTITTLKNPQKDWKIRDTIKQVKQWLVQKDVEINPIIFCRYIATAHYVAEQLQKELGQKNLDIRAITSELSDDERKEKILDMGKSPRRILVATDCLSEGINLQDQFNAVLHYDLPWNPNRLEQREGRVDRYGQISPRVEVRVLFGEDNPIDVVVLKILIEKIKSIQVQSGVNISLADDSRSIMDKVLKEVLLDPLRAQEQFSRQLNLFEGSDVLLQLDKELSRDIELARQKAEQIRSIFAHENIQPGDISQDLKEVDEAIGDVKSLEEFVVLSCRFLGAQLNPTEGGYVLVKANMEQWLADALGAGDRIHLSFLSPTPRGFRYIGRNHRFVELLCHKILSDALEPELDTPKASRAAVFRTDSVQSQTVLIQFRVRNVIRESGTKKELVTEEMFLWGYEKHAEGITPVSYEQCKQLLVIANPLNLSEERQQQVFSEELKHFKQLDPDFIRVVEERSDALVKAHSKFGKYLGARRYETVVPVLPPEILGVYVLIPNVRIS
jgi:superfamily II DNA or RNA helicase